MKKRRLRKLRSLLVELERTNAKIPAKLGSLLESAIKACSIGLGHLPKLDIKETLPFKAPDCELCHRQLSPMAKRWISRFGETFPLRCINPRCSEQGKRKNYIAEARGKWKLTGKLSLLQRPDCPMPRDKCPECAEEGYDTVRRVLRINHPSKYIHNPEVAWVRRCPRKGCPQRPQHFRTDGTMLPHRGQGLPMKDDPNRPLCDRKGCAGHGQPMAIRRPIELRGFGPTVKYECTKGQNEHVCYVTTSGDRIEPDIADKAKMRAWKLDLLPLDMRQCPRPDCTIPLRLGPRSGTIRRKAKSLYGAKGKRLGRRRRLGEEEYRYLLCRGTGKQRGHGSVAVAFGSVKLGTFRFEVIPAKTRGRPRGMSQRQIELAERAERMIQAETARASGKKKGALGKVAAQLFPHENEVSRYQKINKLLSRNRRRKKAYNQT